MPTSNLYTESTISIDRHGPQQEPEYVSRGGGGGRGEEEREYRSHHPPPREHPISSLPLRPPPPLPPPRERGREREFTTKEREVVRYRDGPEILREDYRNKSAGALVLKNRRTEDTEDASRPRRRP